jgi:hypothetical protein
MIYDIFGDDPPETGGGASTGATSTGATSTGAVVPAHQTQLAVSLNAQSYTQEQVIALQYAAIIEAQRERERQEWRAQVTNNSLAMALVSRGEFQPAAAAADAAGSAAAAAASGSGASGSGASGSRAITAAGEPSAPSGRKRGVTSRLTPRNSRSQSAARQNAPMTQAIASITPPAGGSVRPPRRGNSVGGHRRPPEISGTPAGSRANRSNSANAANRSGEGRASGSGGRGAGSGSGSRAIGDAPSTGGASGSGGRAPQSGATYEMVGTMQRPVNTYDPGTTTPRPKKKARG